MSFKTKFRPLGESTPTMNVSVGRFLDLLEPYLYHHYYCIPVEGKYVRRYTEYRN
jgi:hypothetical protein